MRFDIHLRSSVKAQIDKLAEQMKSWEDKPRMDFHEEKGALESINFFAHATRRENVRYAAVDGSGDFPVVSYSDSFVYLVLAHGSIYETDVVSGLREVNVEAEPLVLLCWLPESEFEREQAYDNAFESLAGLPVKEVIERSDYRLLKAKDSHKTNTVNILHEQLIRPHASDSGNIAIQLRSAGEFGVALRLIQQTAVPEYVLVDTTFSLPSSTLPTGSLFYEHLKRLCCVEARKRGIKFFALSKSHGLPAMEQLEDLAHRKAGLEKNQVAEHWYMRLPTADIDGWELALTAGRKIPPIGAISYLVRFHRTTPVMRLDMDYDYWVKEVKGNSETETLDREAKIFSDLDYACHDQRAFGYPYPIKASHDRGSLTKAEREALRKQVIDAAVKAGMKRALFRNPSIETGHE